MTEEATHRLWKSRLGNAKGHLSEAQRSLNELDAPQDPERRKKILARVTGELNRAMDVLVDTANTIEDENG